MWTALYSIASKPLWENPEEDAPPEEYPGRAALTSHPQYVRNSGLYSNLKSKSKESA